MRLPLNFKKILAAGRSSLTNWLILPNGNNCPRPNRHGAPRQRNAIVNDTSATVFSGHKTSTNGGAGFIGLGEDKTPAEVVAERIFIFAADPNTRMPVSRRFRPGDLLYARDEAYSKV